MEKKGIAKSIEPFLEKIESLSQIQRIIISVGSFVVIAGIFIYFLYLPKFEKISSLKKQLTDLEQKLSTAKRNAADLKKFQAKMKEAEAQFNMAMKKLPETKEIPSLLIADCHFGLWPASRSGILTF